MTKRIRTICELIPKAQVFADIGCDHGYCTQYVLKNKLCGRAYISDISAGSLKKAETLLQAEIAAGRCIPVRADGMRGIPEPCDCVLIAGMGGEEIIKILSERELPEHFVLQPMKNAPKLREYLLSRGAKIARDFTFQDGKFYDIIVGEGQGGDQYSDYEILFGRDNLLNPTEEFTLKLREERAKLKNFGNAEMQREAREEILRRLSQIEEVIDAIDDDL